MSWFFRGFRTVIAQWHGSEDKDEGEAWRSPVLQHRFINGKFAIHLWHSAEKIQKDDNGTKVVLFEQPNFEKGVWHHFVYKVRWSYKDDGYIKTWMGGNAIIDYKGPTAYNDKKGPFFKFGVYRDDVPNAYTIYHDEYRRGTSCEDVVPPNFGPSGRP